MSASPSSAVDRALLALQKMQRKLGELEYAAREPIAVVGVACRLPGGVTSCDELWAELLREGDLGHEVPEGRWHREAFTALDPSAPSSRGRRFAALLDGLEQFDARRFSLSRREAERMDPQQRLMLELSAEALEDAGLPPERLAGSRTGVFVGAQNSDFRDLVLQDLGAADAHLVTGGGNCMIPGRVAHVFDFRGPSVCVDTACSSSLVAVHLACSALRNRECDLALAAGVNVILSPTSSLFASKLLELSPDGRSNPFDANANGFVRGEGGAVVALKRLSDARSAGDAIRGLLLGSALSHDGRSSGLTAPNARAQEAAMRAALQVAGVRAEEVSYIEAHGSSTSLGDVIEMEALQAVYGARHEGGERCAIGAIKAKLGNLEAAGSIAALIKVLLSLERGKVAGQPHLRTLNPRMALQHTRFVIPRTALDWAEGGSARRAAVNAFSIPGTNAHVVLGAAPSAAPPAGARRAESAAGRAQVLAFSARSTGALRELAGRYRALLAQDPPIPELAFSAATRRSVFDFRMAVVGATAVELSAAIEQRLAAGVAAAETGGAGRVAFVFPARSDAHLEAARELAGAEPTFASSWAAAGEALRAAAGFTGEDSLQVPGPAASFCLQLSLAALWRSWGVEPEALCGVGLGAVAAATVSGALPLEAAAQLVASVSAGTLDEAGAEVSCAQHARAPGAIPCHFAAASPPQPAREGAMAPQQGRARGVSLRSHAERVVQEGHGVFVIIGHDAALAREFSEALRRARPAGAVPGVVLDSVASDAVTSDCQRNAPVARRKSSRRVMLEGLARLFESGRPTELVRSMAHDVPPDAASVRLPLVPWEHEPIAIAPSWPRPQWPAHPLWGSARELNEPVATTLHETVLSARRPAYLGEHRVRERAVLPAAAFVELALSAGSARFGQRPLRIEGLELPAQLELPDDEAVALQASVSWDQDQGAAEASAARFVVASRGPNAGAFIEHARGRVLPLPEGAAATDQAELGQAAGGQAAGGQAAGGQAAGGQPGAERRATEHRRDLAARGIQVGPAFEGLERLWLLADQVHARVRWTECARQQGGCYVLHPAVLDACLQAFVPVLPPGTWLPSALGKLDLYERPVPGVALQVRATLQAGAGGAQLGHMVISRDDGRPLLRLQELRWLRGDRPAEVGASAPGLAFALRWEERPCPAAELKPGRWLLLADAGGLGRELARALEERGAGVLLVERGVSFVCEAGRASINPEVSEHFARLIEAALDSGPPLLGVVHLLALDLPASAEPSLSELMTALQLGRASLEGLGAALAQRCARMPPRLWLVTHGAQAIDGSSGALGVAQAPLWGQGRALAQSHPELRTTLVDLPAQPGPESVRRLLDELAADAPEAELLLRPEGRSVVRLVRPTFAASALAPAAGRPFALEIDGPCSFDDLTLREVARPAPGPDEVEIEVRATGLNFLDVLTALGVRPDRPAGAARLGHECAGVVSRVGAAVDRFAVGDAVVALADGSLASFARTKAALVARLPSRLTFAQGAGLPVAYATAWYGLLELARLEQGESLLVHAATGGVGIAALEIARARGVEVYATAGSEAKRAYLRERGVARAMDSRSLAFGEETRASTGGRGVDVVLNCLTGAAIERSLSLLAPYGRFVEIAKKDIYEDHKLGLLPFRQNLSYFAVDLAKMAMERPARVARLLDQVVQEVDAGVLPALPITTFAAADLQQAFRLLAQARHIGKVVIELHQANPLVVAGHRPAEVKGNVLLVGELDARAAALAAGLLELGAARLLSASPAGHSAAASPAPLPAGVAVEAVELDLKSVEAIAAWLGELERRGERLSGIIVLASSGAASSGAAASGQSAEVSAWREIEAAWNLHLATRSAELDWFVLVSSAAALVGAPGSRVESEVHACFAALARHRRALGARSCSVACGPWQGASAPEQRSGAATLGLASLLPAEAAAEVLRHLGERQREQRAVLALNPRLWLDAHPQHASAGLWEHLQRESACAGPSTLREALVPLGAAERQRALLEHVTDVLGRVLRVSPERLSPSASFGSLGLDSLMGIEMKTRLEHSLGVPLSTTLLWTSSTPEALAARLSSELGLPSPPAQLAASATPSPAADDLNLLSEDELAAQLAQELTLLRGT